MVGNDNEEGSTIATAEKVNFADCPDLRLAKLNLTDWVSASYKPMLHSPDYCTSEPLGVRNSLQCTKTLCFLNTLFTTVSSVTQLTHMLQWCWRKIFVRHVLMKVLYSTLTGNFH